MEGDASALVDFVAGTVGGVASLLTGHPFDTIKTRLQAQSQSNSSPSIRHVSSVPSSSTSPLLVQATRMTTTTATNTTFRYTSAFDAFRRIVTEERFLGLYKGVTSPMLGVAVMNASIFGVYGMALRKFQSDDIRPSLSDIFLAGCISGIVSAFITSPIELIKIRQQLACVALPKQPSTMYVIRDIYREGGFRGMYRGLGSTCIRDLGYGPYFLSYEVFNRFLLSTKRNHSTSLTNLDLALSGGLAGILAWMSTFGADVIKTRVQATNRGSGEGFAFLSAGREIYREGGWKSFFAGAGPTLLRALPVNAVLFITFEATKDFLYQRGY